MHLHHAFAITSLVFLTACGGAETGGAAASASITLRQFADGALVTRQRFGADAAATVYQTMGTASRSAAFDPGRVPATVTTFAQSISSPDGVLTRGTTRVNGTTVPAISYTSGTGGLRAGYLDYADGGLLFAGGPAPSALPSGRVFYSGSNVGGPRSGEIAEYGSFRIEADFDADTLNLTGRTDNSRISADAINLNRADGTFSTTALMATVDGQNLTGTISGSFHGAGATGVTAIYNDNATTPLFAGALVGTR